jgi:hypothetical protein
MHPIEDEDSSSSDETNSIEEDSRFIEADLEIPSPLQKEISLNKFQKEGQKAGPNLNFQDLKKKLVDMARLPNGTVPYHDDSTFERRPAPKKNTILPQTLTDTGAF